MEHSVSRVYSTAVQKMVQTADQYRQLQGLVQSMKSSNSTRNKTVRLE